MLIFLAKFGMDGLVLASWKETMGNRGFTDGRAEDEGEYSR